MGNSLPKLKLPRPMDLTGVEQAYPDFLRNLLSDTTSASSAQFREHIRSYTRPVSFASLGAKIVVFAWKRSICIQGPRPDLSSNLSSAAAQQSSTTILTAIRA